jgi:hypothetical protein
MPQPRAFFQNAITAGFFLEFWICSFVPILGPILSLFLQKVFWLYLVVGIPSWEGQPGAVVNCLFDSAHALNFQFGLKFFFFLVLCLPHSKETTPQTNLART